VYLIGNKSEMEEQREVTFQRALEFAKEYKLHKVFETSAKTGYNVEEVFAMVAKELYLQVKREAEAQAQAQAEASQ
jgi:Ras-related protein Rab-14